MKTYYCYYGRLTTEVSARSPFEAQCLAAKHLKLQESQRHMISARRTALITLGETHEVQT